MRFVGTAYRAHDPRWSFQPLSGAGAAVRGGRFNPPATPTLYLALSLVGAVREANQGLAFRIDPCVLCAYAIDCEDVVDLRDDAGRAAAGITEAELARGWLTLAKAGREPPTWTLARRLIGAGAAGVLVPSFAPGAERSDGNLVLWRWGEAPPHQCTVHDPSGRLSRDQASWGVG